MARGRTTVALAATLGAVAIAGCGGSEPTKAEFAKKADALCAQINTAHPPPERQTAATLREEVSIRRELDKKIRDLDVPDELKKDFDTYNAATQRIIAAISRMGADLARRDTNQFREDQKQYDAIAGERERPAVKLGFRVCGRTNPVT